MSGNTFCTTTFVEGAIWGVEVLIADYLVFFLLNLCIHVLFVLFEQPLLNLLIHLGRLLYQ